MSDEDCLYHLRWRKKKVDGFIIPAKFFYDRLFSIEVTTPDVVDVEIAQTSDVTIAEVVVSEAPKEEIPENNVPKASLFSLAGMKKLRELESQQSSNKLSITGQVSAEPFTETEFLIQWNKYAMKLSQQGEKIMESLMMMSEPVVNGFEIIHEMPNDSSRIDFENNMTKLLGYLRSKLHNHEIKLTLKVNESINTKMAFTPQDRFNRLNQINPALETLRKTFDLDF